MNIVNVRFVCNRIRSVWQWTSFNTWSQRTVNLCVISIFRNDTRSY